MLSKWDPTRGLGLDGFVGLVADRQVASILRSGKRSPWLEDPTSDEDLTREVDVDARDTSSPERITASRDLCTKILDRLRERLSVTGLRLFHLTIVEEQAVEDVCAETGLQRGAVYTWKSRILSTIQGIARELEDEEATPTTKRQAGGDR